MIISLISQKGGVGKSALARLIAVELARAGWRVLIADLDAAQGTSTHWKIRRDREGIEPDVDVSKFRSVERALKEAPRYDALILDGPAHAGTAAVAMARAADHVILPSGYSLDDLEPQVSVAFELDEAGIDLARVRIVLCRTRGSAKEGQGVRAYIKRAGLQAATHELRELPTYRQAHTSGRAASECGHPKPANEARELAAELVATLEPTP